MFCSKCGTKIQEGDLFCQSCGEKHDQSQCAPAPGSAATTNVAQSALVEFNGKQIPAATIANINASEKQGGLAYRGVLDIVVRFTATIEISFKDSSPVEFVGYSGWSVFGIGNKWSAKKKHKNTCQALYEQVGPAMVKERIDKIRFEKPYRIARSTAIEKHAQNWEIRGDGILYYRGLKEKFMPKEEFSHCKMKGDVVYIYTKNGKKFKQPATANLFFNLMLLEVINTLYK